MENNGECGHRSQEKSYCSTYVTAAGLSRELSAAMDDVTVESGGSTENAVALCVCLPRRNASFAVWDVWFR